MFGDAMAMRIPCLQFGQPTKPGRAISISEARRKTFGVGLAVFAGPKAIRLIALDTVNGHQRAAGAQPNKIASL
jgi:hypothetical protein